MNNLLVGATQLWAGEPVTVSWSGVNRTGAPLVGNWLDAVYLSTDDRWDINDVLWALCTRVDPIKDMDVTRRCWSNPLDPIIPKSERGFSSRAIIDACRPYEWMKDFPKVSGASAELKAQILKKYSDFLSRGETSGERYI